ncbi:YesL family protein [Virgibacillus salexigens]|uniref:DUF624 domain-containing protein n=1 Tax=Virgibacillus kapii TaxID=1638645 RepID=A0ABQ2DAP1_9BACI|nr:YesL family protein [Virgibacillus kapii]GGJ51818.1 hypothetical protein GCM10007111_12370 [Virgibacillus kapii]
MNPNGIVTTLEKVMNWISRFAVVNFLWLLYSLMGLFVAGVFPATVAALGVSRKWIAGNKEIPIWRTFKEVYFKEFAAANVLGWILTAIGTVLFLNYKVLQVRQEEVVFMVPFAFYFVVIVYCLVVIWSFPLLAHYQTSIYKYMKHAFIIGLSKVHITLGIFVTSFGLIYLSISYPAFLPLLFFSVFAFSWMWGAMYVFSQMDTANV